MTNIMALSLLAFAVSIDSFSVGFTYGLKQMRIPLASIIVIACMSAATMLLSMYIGGLLSKVLSAGTAEKIGGSLLIMLGIWVLYQNFRPQEKDIPEEAEEKVIATIEMKYFGIAINILKKPMDADLDRSGTIVGIEAVVLGIALSLDAFAAGLGAAMLGFPPLLLAGSIGVMSALFIKMGMGFGTKLSYQRWINQLSYLPGILLILLGVLKW